MRHALALALVLNVTTAHAAVLPSASPAPAAKPTPKPVATVAPASVAPAAPPAPVVTAKPVPVQAGVVKSAADVDAQLAATWAAAHAKPAVAASPAAWLRRVWLDLAGTIPPSTSVREFLADSSPDARSKVVAQLLAGRAWSQHWGRLLAKHLVVPKAEPDLTVPKTLAAALADRLQAGATWPSIARSLVGASGESVTATAFRSQFADAPHEVAGQLGSAVFGMRVRCAQCHDDPLHAWKVADYYGLAAFFGSPRRANVPAKLFEAWKGGKVKSFFDLVVNLPEIKPKTSDHRWVWTEIQGYVDELKALQKMGLSANPVPEVAKDPWTVYDIFRLHAERRVLLKGDGGFGQRMNLVFDREGTDLLMPPLPASPVATVGAPATGRPVTPRWPGDPGRAAPPRGERRAALAAYVGNPDNVLVARAFVNRVWAELMGHGLVEPVDEVVRPSEARHQELLERLADGFCEHSGNVRWLLTTIVTSRAYGMACDAGEPGGVPLAARPPTRAHHGTQIEVGDGVSQAAPVGRGDAELLFAVRVARALDGDQVEASLRRATGRDAGSVELTKALAKTFNPPAATPIVDETGAAKNGLAQGLFLLTGPELQKLVEEAPLLGSLGKLPSVSAALDELFLRTFSRPPDAGERARLEPVLSRLPGKADTRRPWADTLWALVSSAEFLSNH